MLYAFIILSILAMLSIGLRALFSYIIRPAVFFDKPEHQSRSYGQAYHTPGLNKDPQYNVICLLGNADTFGQVEYINEETQRLSDVPSSLDDINYAVKTLYPQYSIKEHGISYYQPAYHHSAERCVNEIVKHVEKNKGENKATVLVGISLGGAFAALAVEKLKRIGIDIDLISLRSFQSIGAVATSLVRLDPNSGIGSVLIKPLLDTTLNMFGGWNLNAYQAIKNIEKLNEHVESQAHTDRKASRILIAGHQNDSLLGKGSLHFKYKKKQKQFRKIFVSSTDKSPKAKDDHNNRCNKETFALTS